MKNKPRFDTSLVTATSGSCAVKKGEWPNNATWAAGRDNMIGSAENGYHGTFVIPCGKLSLPSGKLVICDAFDMRPAFVSHVVTPRGDFSMTVTVGMLGVCPVGEPFNRKAYASITFTGGNEHYRAVIAEVNGNKALKPKEKTYYPSTVAPGISCFVDESVLAQSMPTEGRSLMDLYEDCTLDAIASYMVDFGKCGIGIVTPSRSSKGENLVMVQSGSDKKRRPLVGSYDKNGRLLAIHVDFRVIS